MGIEDIEGGGQGPEGGVSGSAAPAGDDNFIPQDDGAGDAGEAGADQGQAGAGAGNDDRSGRPARRENAIPHSRVREMLARERAEALRQAQEQVKPLLERLQQFNPESLQQGIAQKFLEAMYPGAQISKKEPPKYVTQQEMQELLKQRDETWQREQAKQVQMAQAKRELDDVKRKYADVFEEFPKMEHHIVNAWGASPGMTMTQVAQAVIEDFNAVLDKRGAKYAEGKREDQKIRPIAPGGRGTPQVKKHDLGTEEGAAAAALEMLDRQGSR